MLQQAAATPAATPATGPQLHIDRPQLPDSLQGGVRKTPFRRHFVCSLLMLILLPRQAWDKQEETLRKDGGLSFPYVCPEPVLVKWRILYINGVYLFVQDERRGRNVFSLLPPAHLCGRDCKREAAPAGHDALAGDDRGELAARWRELGRRPSLRVVRANADVLSHFIPRLIILPRQARDKYRETLKQRFVFRRSDYINHVYDTLDGQLAGQLWWSVDVGGFFCQMDEETLARDFMLSATAPIMRQVMKRFLFSHFYIKTIMLPRQPRDEHKENSKTDRFLAARRS